MIDPMLREIIVFSIALTLPTYFVRVIDKIPALFKRIKLWWKTHHCGECGRWFQWEVSEDFCAARSVCNACIPEEFKDTRVTAKEYYASKNNQEEKR